MFVMTAPTSSGQGERRGPRPGEATLLLEDVHAPTDPSRIHPAPSSPWRGGSLEPGLVIYVKGYQDPTPGQRIATRLLRE
jgi:hypothetical protein